MCFWSCWRCYELEPVRRTLVNECIMTISVLHHFEPGESAPLYRLYRYLSPQTVWFLRRFALKTDKDAHFGLESSIVLKETTGVHVWAYLSFQFQMNQKERVMSEFEMVFKKSFCLSSSLKVMTVFTPLPGLKTGMNLRGRACVENNIF